MARRHQMTARRRAALKKAQAASARKRRGTGKSTSRKRKMIGYGLYYGGLAAIAYGVHKHNQSVKRQSRRIAAKANVKVRESTTSPIIRESRKIAKGGSRVYSSAVLRRGIDQRASTRAVLRKQTRRKKR